MMDLGTILGIVSLAIQVVGSVDKAITIFEQSQAAPQELQNFKGSVFRFQRQFSIIKSAWELQTRRSPFIQPSDLLEIQDTLELCDNFFSNQAGPLSTTAPIRGAFTSASLQKLNRLKTKIDDHYSNILMPFMLDSIYGIVSELQRQTSTASSEAGNDDAPPCQEAGTGATPVVPAEELQCLRELLEALQSTDDRNVTEKKLREMDIILQGCWSKLGLLDGEIFDDAGLTAITCLVDRRRTSALKFEPAPTILTLNGAPEKHEKLKLERVHIMTRDDEARMRIIQYQSRDTSIHVTHIIPYSSIPFTQEKGDRGLSFLYPHVITVHDDVGYHVYHLRPKYRFKTVETCETFMSILRERKLLGAFDAAEIRLAGTIVSLMQVIRFWERERPNGQRLVTMTFLQSLVGDKRQHNEIDISKLGTKPVFILPPLPIFPRPSTSNSLSIIARHFAEPRQDVRIRFETVKVATEFKNLYEANHPFKIPVSQTTPNNLPMPSLLGQQHMSASPSAPATQTGRQLSQHIPPVNLLPPAQMGRNFLPSLGTTPQETPSDTTWNSNTASSAASFLSLGAAASVDSDDDMLEQVLGVMDEKKEEEG